MKKGFTLVELLAVIVILAIIALIAVPIILNIISDAEVESELLSAQNYIDAVDKSIMRYNMGNRLVDATCEVQSDGNLDCDGVEIIVDVEKTVATEGTIKLKSRKIIKVENLKVGDNYYLTDPNGKLVKVGTPFTGTIYRQSNQVMNNGVSINERWCAVISQMELNSCVHNSTANSAFSSQEDCQTMISQFAQIPGYEAIATAATCVLATDPLIYYGDTESIDEKVYFKHNVENDIVTASYSCMRISGNELCLEGGNSSYYGTFDGISSSEVSSVSNLHPTGNISKISSNSSYFSSCSFSSTKSSCGNSELEAWPDGHVRTKNETSGVICTVDENGVSSCHS